MQPNSNFRSLYKHEFIKVKMTVAKGFRNRPLKIFFSAVLLVLILLNSGGSYFIFKYSQFQQQKEIKTSIRNGMSNNELEKIVVSSKNFKQLSWLKPGKEFTYQGYMYDVVRSTRKGNRIVLFCINDKVEKNLVDNYLKNSKTSKRFFKWAKTIKFTPPTLEYICLKCSSKSSFISYSNSFELLPCLIDSPPPKIV